MASKSNAAGLEQELARHALSKAGSVESRPWGHIAVKVRAKNFVFLSSEGGALSLSVKLTASHEDALNESFVTPTGYGLGRAGWVTARFEGDEPVPMATLRAWIDESYGLMAPPPARAKKPAAEVAPAAKKKPAVEKPAAKKKPARAAK